MGWLDMITSPLGELCLAAARGTNKMLLRKPIWLTFAFLACFSLAAGISAAEDPSAEGQTAGSPECTAMRRILI